MDGIEQMGLVVVFAIVLLASPLISQLLDMIINGVLSGFNAIMLATGL